MTLAEMDLFHKYKERQRRLAIRSALAGIGLGLAALASGTGTACLAHNNQEAFKNADQAMNQAGEEYNKTKQQGEANSAHAKKGFHDARSQYIEITHPNSFPGITQEIVLWSGITVTIAAAAGSIAMTQKAFRVAKNS